MFQIEQDPGQCTGVAFIHQHGAALQQVAIALQREVDDSIEQRMARTDKGRQRLSLGGHQGFLEGDALVTWEYGLTDTDESVAVTHRGGNVGDFITAGFALLDCAPELFEGFVKEGFDVVGLQAACVGAFHVLPDTLYPASIHGIVGEHSFFE